MTCNEFLKAMAAEGFTGKFRATNDEMVISGEIKQGGEIQTVRHKSREENSAELKSILKQLKG